MPTNPDEKILLEQVLNSQIRIPPQPAILREIDRLISQPDNSLADIANLICKDAGLSAAIFKLVTSPFYNMPMPISNMQKAISILGLSQVTNLIKGLSLRKEIGGQEVAYEKFWERSQEIASLCAIIARKQISACNIAVDQAYLAGLFHECGVPILMQRFPEYGKTFKLNSGSNWPDFQEEDHRFNTDHTVVGYLVSRHWNLPEFICQAVRFHHDTLSVDHAALTMVSILQLARHLRARLHNEPDKDPWDKQQESVMEEIGVDSDSAKEFMEDVLDIFNQQQE